MRQNVSLRKAEYPVAFHGWGQPFPAGLGFVHLAPEPSVIIANDSGHDWGFSINSSRPP
jgi:hypothetical protein